MSQTWVIEILKILVGGGLITLFIELYRNYKNKNRESAEVSNIYKEGQELNIHIKTNIDKYVDEKTNLFKAQISELEKTIIQISTKYRTDLEKYIGRIADLEKKFDEQLNRNQQIEDDLTKESKDRATCYELLKVMQATLTSIENQKKL